MIVYRGEHLSLIMLTWPETLLQGIGFKMTNWSFDSDQQDYIHCNCDLKEKAKLVSYYSLFKKAVDKENIKKSRRSIVKIQEKSRIRWEVQSLMCEDVIIHIGWVEKFYIAEYKDICIKVGNVIVSKTKTFKGMPHLQLGQPKVVPVHHGKIKKGKP